MMLEARDAAKLSEQYEKENISSEIFEIDKLVREACKRGDRYIIFYKELGPRVAKALKDFGYKIDSPQFENGSRISW